MPEYFDLAAEDVPQLGALEWLTLLRIRLAKEGLALADLPSVNDSEFFSVLAALGFDNAVERLVIRKVVRELGSDHFCRRPPEIRAGGGQLWEPEATDDSTICSTMDEDGRISPREIQSDAASDLPDSLARACAAAAAAGGALQLGAMGPVSSRHSLRSALTWPPSAVSSGTGDDGGGATPRDSERRPAAPASGAGPLPPAVPSWPWVAGSPAPGTCCSPTTELRSQSPMSPMRWMAKPVGIAVGPPGPPCWPQALPPRPQATAPAGIPMSTPGAMAARAPPAPPTIGPATCALSECSRRNTGPPPRCVVATAMPPPRHHGSSFSPARPPPLVVPGVAAGAVQAAVVRQESFRPHSRSCTPMRQQVLLADAPASPTRGVYVRCITARQLSSQSLCSVQSPTLGGACSPPRRIQGPAPIGSAGARAAAPCMPLAVATSP